MTREAVGAALLLLGAVVVRLTVTGEYLAFVKSSLMIPLLLSAAVLVVLGAAEMRAHAKAGDDEEPSDHHGHEHAGAGPRMGALLLAPLAVLMLVPAVPLGAFAMDNGASNRVPEIEVFGDLPPADETGVVDLLLPELVGRSLIEPEPLDDASIRVIGFVVPDDDVPGTYLLSRFTVGCCAVDAAPYQLRVQPDGASVPEREQWVEVVVRFTGEVEESESERMPVFDLLDQQPIDEPEVPYVY